MKKEEGKKKSKLRLKRISKPNEKFGVHSLNEVREVDSYTWVAKNITEEMGFPPCVKDTDDCLCCEGQLFVLRHGAEEPDQSTDSFGQVLTIINHESGSTSIFTRTLHPLQNKGEWTPWLMVATGDYELIEANNSINEILATLRRQLEDVSKRVEAVEASLLAGTTVRFHRIEENEVTINTGEIDSTPATIVYYKPANKFVAADSAGNYWDTWSGMEAYMSGGAIRKDKVYLCRGVLYTVLNTMLVDSSQYSMCFSDTKKFEIGTVSVTGELQPAFNRVRLENRIQPEKTVFLRFPDNVKISLRFYNDEGFIIGSEWIAKTINLDNYIPEGASSYMVVAAFADDSDISSAAYFSDNILFCTELGKKVSENGKLISKTIEELNIKSSSAVPCKFTVGTIGLSGVVDDSSTTRVKTAPNALYESLHISFPSVYKVSLRFYSNDTFVSTTEWINTAFSVSDLAPDAANYYRIVAAYADDSEIQDATQFDKEIAVSLSIQEKIKEDSTLSIPCFFTKGTVSLSGVVDDSSTTRVKTAPNALYESLHISFPSVYKVSLRFYSNDTFVSTTEWINTAFSVSDLAPDAANYYRIVAAYADDSEIQDAAQFDKGIVVKQDTKENIDILSKEVRKSATVSNSGSSSGNFTILCAKEHTYNDGTQPVTEWFLIEEPNTQRCYITKDFCSKRYVFTFVGDIFAYSFGVMPNGDILAVRLAYSLGTSGDDNRRMNPYIFKASENWSRQRAVDFGNGLKPCGWLENCGFRALPNGDVLFCEYTRISVRTSNVWKISGDASTPSNWSVKKTFELSGEADTGFKHCHTVQHDHYTGVCYFATGDDDTAAAVYYSLDYGDTWSMLREASEKYCRLLAFTFTEEYIYWGSDSAAYHYFFKARRGADGVLDYSSVEEIPIPAENGLFATYGQAYLPMYKSVFLFDRQDGGGTAKRMPLRLVNLDTLAIKTIGYMEAAADGVTTGIGFRTLFSEWYPQGNIIRVSFGGDFYTYNRNKVCGNKGIEGAMQSNIHNLVLCVFEDCVQISTMY